MRERRGVRARWRASPNTAIRAVQGEGRTCRRAEVTIRAKDVYAHPGWCGRLPNSQTAFRRNRRRSPARTRPVSSVAQARLEAMKMAKESVTVRRSTCGPALSCDSPPLTHSRCPLAVLLQAEEMKAKLDVSPGARLRRVDARNMAPLTRSLLLVAAPQSKMSIASSKHETLMKQRVERCGRGSRRASGPRLYAPPLDARAPLRDPCVPCA